MRVGDLIFSLRGRIDHGRFVISPGERNTAISVSKCDKEEGLIDILAWANEDQFRLKTTLRIERP